MSKVYVIMGVSGSGKTTVGRALAEKLHIPFYDADDFHPESNVQKMAKGVPLTDTDRQPWLEELQRNIADWNKTSGAVLACSSLKEAYRETLRTNNDIGWVVLTGTFETIENRMKQREHYMPSSLLQSQFDALELPPYGLHLDITAPPEELVKAITENVDLSEFGVLGLGVMGKSLAKNCLNKGISLAVYNRISDSETNVVSEFLDECSGQKIKGFTALPTFVEQLSKPRRILMMVAAPAVDMVIDEIITLLDPGDVLIDGGNSFYKHTEQRTQRCEEHNIHFIGLGVSGGEFGALHGPSMMAGGSKRGYEKSKVILQSISAKDSINQSCINFFGNYGAGHFIKMVHNGIEYAEMQLLAELYTVLDLPNEKIAQLFEVWNDGPLSSYLLEITIDILRFRDETGDGYLIDKIIDVASGKGTGVWTGRAALQYGVVGTMTQAAVNARLLSANKEQRQSLAKKANKPASLKSLDPNIAKEAYAFARIINHFQGFELIKLACLEYGWEYNPSEIARVWTNGCIIRSELMQSLVSLFSKTVSPLEHSETVQQLEQLFPNGAQLIQLGLQNRVPLPCHSAAVQYWLQITQGESPANLIQAQRDYFGSHGYQRTDASPDTNFTTHWKNG